MKNKKIEEGLARALKAQTPNVLDSVLADCSAAKASQKGIGNGKVIAMTKKNRLNKLTKWTAGIAAALVLLVGCTFGIGTWLNSGVNATIGIDVNPSIRLQLNKNNTILQILANNEDAEDIIENLETTDNSLDSAVDAIVTALVNEGYLTEDTNSVLVSVECDNEKKGKDLQQKLTEEINDALADKELSGSVVSQTVVAPDSELKSLAEQYGISIGKARLIRELAATGTHDFDDLHTLTVNELNLLLADGNKKIENVTTDGNASDKAYIGEARAIEIALADAATTADLITKLETELDYEHGVLVYEIEFDLAEFEYEYDINATTGEIVKAEIDRDDDDNDKEDKKEEAPQNVIGNDAAVAAAVAKAGVALDTITKLESELEHKNDVWFYEVMFKVDQTKYEYDVDALTGTILNEKIKENTGNEKEEDKVVPENIIGKDAAKAIALEKAGCTEKAVSSIKAKLKNSDDAWFYEVEFELGKTEYEYHIDAVTSEILAEKIEEDKQNDKEPVPENAIGQEAAAAAALAKAGVSETDVTKLKSKLDRKKGAWVYEVEFKLNKVEYEYIVDAVTGEILNEKIDENTDKDDDKDDDQVAPENIIDAEAAKAVALKKAGLTEETVRFTKVKLKNSKDVWFYDVEFEVDKTEYEYHIDAITSEILAEKIEEDKHVDKDPAPEITTGVENTDIIVPDPDVKDPEPDHKEDMGEFEGEVTFDTTESETVVVDDSMTEAPLTEEIEK